METVVTPNVAATFLAVRVSPFGQRVSLGADLAFAERDVGMPSDLLRPPTAKPSRGVGDLSHPVTAYTQRLISTGEWQSSGNVLARTHVTAPFPFHTRTPGLSGAFRAPTRG
jgi:hypothetical protein